MKTIFKFSYLIFFLLFLNSCKPKINQDEFLDESNENIVENIKSDKNRIQIRFSCGEGNISEYTDKGWKIVEESSIEKICTWKSFPATKDCDMEKDKGCKITEPDKIGTERIFVLEK